MSDIDTPDGEGAMTTNESRTGRAKAAIGQAGQALKQEAQSFAAAAQNRAMDEAKRRTDAGARTLGDFANAIRRAGEELSSADQSPAARLIGQAADGLESLSRNLSDKRPEELLDAVRDFGRRHPVAFIGGAVLVGVALGRFVRASDADGLDQDAFVEPMVEAQAAAGLSSYAAGPAATGDEALSVAEEDAFDGDAEFTGAKAAATDLESPMADDLGGLEPTEIEDTSTSGADRGGRGG